mgnify:CR=1 FL=1
MTTIIITGIGSAKNILNINNETCLKINNTIIIKAKTEIASILITSYLYILKLLY